MTTEVGDRERGGYWTIIREEPIEEECENFTCTLIFKNCTINGSAISPSGLIHSGKFGPGNVAYKVKIDNPVYSVIRGAHDDDITLTAE